MKRQGFFNVEYLGEVTSTNTLLKEFAREGAREGTVLVARSQTAGRGRKDRKFYSSGRGLYASVLLRPENTRAELSGRFTALAAVALSRALKKMGFSPKIKWVNDVYLEKKKVAGILAEGAVDGSGNLEYVVIGIGVNIAPPDGGFPEEIKEIATALYECYEEEKREELLSLILNGIEEIYRNKDWDNMLDDYREDSLLIGKKITVVEGKYQGKATALEIDDDFRLVVETKDGRLALDSGEVRIKL